MTAAPPAEVLASIDLLAGATTESVGGATGRLWKVLTADGPFALRWSPSGDTVARHRAAMRAAAAAGLPVPEEVGYARTPSGEVLVQSWLRGRTVFDEVRAHPDRAADLGRLMGTTQRRLHEVPAPAELSGVLPAPPPDPADVRPDGLSGGLPDGLPGGVPDRAVLHLDWHGYNLLVDDEGITGIIDWDNARAGHPLLDVARTHALLTIDPALRAATPDERRLVGELARGWAEGYGLDAASIPASCLVWAGRHMLADVAGRYASDPSALDELRRWTAEWTARARPDA